MDKTSAQDDFTVSDERDDLPIFIHSELDDTPLSSEAFRLYAHIARRAGQKGGLCWSSYQSMGDICFIVDYPNSKVTRRNHAIAGIKELVEKRLISIEKRKNGKTENLTNVYTLNPKRLWLKEGGSPTELGGSPTEPLGGSPTELGGSPTEPKGTPMKLLHSSEGSSFKEAEDCKKNNQVKSQLEPSTAESLTPSSNLNKSAVPSIATQRDDRSAAAKFEQNFNDRANGNLYPWRTGRGPNGWRSDVLDEYVRRAREKYPNQKNDRGDAVGFFVNCEMEAKRGNEEVLDKGFILVEELLQRIELRQSALSPTPYQPPEPEPQFDPEEQRRAKEKARQIVKADKAAREGISNGTRT